MEHEFLLNLGLALVAGLLGGLIARLARLPVLLGYLAAGVVVGPHTPGVFAQPESVQEVANLGVALLMFAVGVQFSLRELLAIRRLAISAGVAQISLTSALGLGAGLLLGWSPSASVMLGFIIAISSTAIAMRLLEERGELGSAHGTAMLGISVVQDLAVVAMVAMLPLLSPTAGLGTDPVEFLATLGRTAVLLIGTLVLALRGVPYLLHCVALAGSRELFLITVLGVCLGAAILAELAGLGLPLGAFIAGLVISESDYADDVLSQVRPLRDVFAALFFVSVGMLLDPAVLARHAADVLLVVSGIVIGKALITFAATMAAGAHGRTAIFAGMGLAQIGEFSFVLAGTAVAKNILDGEQASVILASAWLTILFSPLLFHVALPTYAALSRWGRLARILNREGAAWVPDELACSGGRVVVLGYGRVGRAVSTALCRKGVAHVVVDYDGRAVEGARQAGVPVVYGDAASDLVLRKAGLECTEIAVVALPEADTTAMAVRLLKRLAPHLAIVARVHRGIDMVDLRAAGADVVVQAEFEAASEMVRQGLDRLGFPDPEVDAYLEELRAARYRVREEQE